MFSTNSNQISVDSTHFFSSLTCLVDLELTIQTIFSKVDRIVSPILHWPAEKMMLGIRTTMSKKFGPLEQSKRPFAPFYVHFVIDAKNSAVLIFCGDGAKIQDIECPDFSFCYK